MSKELDEVKDSQIQVIDLSQAKEAMAAFQRFKADVLTDDDFFVISSDPKRVRHVRKSGWMKYAMALGVTTHVYDEVCQTIKFNDRDVLVYNFSAKAIAPNGRSAEAVGSASSDEGKPWASAIHSIRAMAQTRAVERAISNLIGGGEVGAEELDTKSVDAEFTVKRKTEKFSTNTTISGVQLSEADLAQGDAVSGLLDVIEAAKLDPAGVEIRNKDYGILEVIPILPKQASKEEDNALWRKYHDVIRGAGGIYHGKDDLDELLRGHWTVNVA